MTTKVTRLAHGAVVHLAILVFTSLCIACSTARPQLVSTEGDTCPEFPSGPEPHPQCSQSCAEDFQQCTKPTQSQIFNTMVAVDYYSKHPISRDDVRVSLLPPAKIRQVLACDRSFGWDARLAFAKQILGGKSRSILTPCLNCLAANMKSSLACCASIDACRQAEATPDDMRAAIDYRLYVPGHYARIAKILDPQCWPTIPGSAFKTAERQSKPECPIEKPTPLGRPPKDVGKTWCGSLFEQVEYAEDPRQAQSFSNSLFFDTRLKPNGPCSYPNSTECYELDYGLCEGGSYEGDWGGNSASGGLIRDSGCTSANSDGSSSTSVVTGVKRLDFEGKHELCGNDGCDDKEAALMNSMMNAIMIGTRISVCALNGQPAQCEFAPCPLKVPMGENFECGVTDFRCN